MYYNLYFSYNNSESYSFSKQSEISSIFIFCLQC